MKKFISGATSECVMFLVYNETFLPLRQNFYFSYIFRLKESFICGPKKLCAVKMKEGNGALIFLIRKFL